MVRDALGKVGFADGVVLVAPSKCDQVYDEPLEDTSDPLDGGGACNPDDNQTQRSGYQREEAPIDTSGIERDPFEHFCMVTDWWVSYDNGKTWRPDGTTVDYCV